MAVNQELTLPHGRTCPSCGLQVQSSVSVCPRDGTNLVQPLYVDPAFAKYEFISGIGAGGMGVIYKARHTILNKMVAIKTLHAHLASPEAVGRFEIEGKAASLLSHPNIIKVYDIGLTQTGQPYMIMDFVDGYTMSELLQNYGQIPLKHFLPIFLQVTDALGHAHKRSVLHRDVKPSNLMLIFNENKEYEVRIMDFGIAKVLDDTMGSAQNLTKTGEAIGSPIYMSPEQARGQKMDHRSDLYSLGCVMYEALTGSVPFLGNTSLDTMLMHMEQKPMPLREASMGSAIDPRLEQIVLRLLEKNPLDRYQSMDELKMDLEVLKDPQAPALPSAKVLQEQELVRKEKFKQSAPASQGPDNLLIATLAIGLLAIFAGIGGFAYFSLKKPPVEKEPADLSKMSTKVDVPIIGGLDVDAKKGLDTAVMEHSIVINLKFFNNKDKLTDADLSVLKKARRVRLIGFEECSVTDAGLENIRNWGSLFTLQVSSTRVKTLKVLSSLPVLSCLTAKNLQLDPVAFVNIGKVKTLTTLYLNGSNVTDADLVHLYGLTELTGLDLSGTTALSIPAIDKLQNQLPQCEILRTEETGDEAAVGDKNLQAKKVGPMPRFVQAKNLAAQGEWVKANEKVSEAMCLILRTTQQELQGRIYALKGDCQYQLKLPRSAVVFYKKASKLTPFEGAAIPLLYKKMALAYETFPEQPAGLNLAIEERAKANTCFENMPSGKEIELEKNDNLERMAMDNLQVKRPAAAQSILTNLLQTATGESKVRYTKLLGSIHK